MRFVRLAGDRSGVLLPEDSGSTKVLEISDELPDRVSWLPLIEDWESWKPRLAKLIAAAQAGEGGHIVGAVNELELLPPLPSPISRIFALGTNFADHVDRASAVVDTEESRDTVARRPLGGFFVIPGTVYGHERDITPPKEAVKVDYEAEVAVVLATGGLHVGPEAFQIWGHTAYNDLSIRDPHLGVGLTDLDKGTLSWALQKNFQGGNVCGPWLTVDEGYDYGNLSIVSRVDGNERQNGSTTQMLYSFAEGAASIARFVEFRPGDLLTSGTPSGTAIEQGVDGPFLQSGAVVEVEIEGVGILRNRIVR
jgi:2-keto-4-pentenoate hydratase/2-oxohepta-3-ene-1,7-dioic acid hydratase in catechol pathway